jgi:hypothetical protein
MPWELRGRQQVYYRVQKVAGRVVRTYCGSGDRGRQAYEEDLRRRAAREALARDRRARQERVREAERLLAALGRLTDALARADLMGQGFFRHAKGAWRRKRHVHHDGPGGGREPD